MRSITIIIAFYENSQMLTLQYEMMRLWPAALRPYLRLIIVDDGSPENPAHAPSPELGFDFSLYRMDVDIRWNQDACRNIGVHHAETEWILMTDMDHLIPSSTISRAVKGALNPQIVYQFARINANRMELCDKHVNSWLMTKAIYGRIGGYDERFAGLYGTDIDFRRRTSRKAQIKQLPNALIKMTRQLVPDSITRRYERTVTTDRQIIEELRVARTKENKPRPKRLTFPYRKVV